MEESKIKNTSLPVQSEQSKQFESIVLPTNIESNGRKSKLVKYRSLVLGGLIIIVSVAAFLLSYLGGPITTKSDIARMQIELNKSGIPETYTVYTNNQYRFEMEFPLSWSEMKVSVVNNGTSTNYPEGVFFDDINFNLKTINGSYQKVCSIRIFSKEDWQKVMVGVYVPTELNQKDNKVYTADCGEDDTGFKGFEKYTGADGGIGPGQEFQTISSTFKFI